jgi:hypothetical protein
MPTLLMCPATADVESLKRFHRVPDGALLDRWGQEPRMLAPGVPYLLGSDAGFDESLYLSELWPCGPLLCDMCQDFGCAATLGLADISFDLRRHTSGGLSFAGAMADVYQERIGRFSKAMEQHQQAIAAYHRATRPGAPKSLSKVAARDALLRSGAELRANFHHELERVTRNWYPRSSMLVSGSTRVPDRVRHSRKLSRLDVASKAQLSRLVELARNAKYLGRGLVLIDLGRRALNVHEVYEAGGDWQRQAFVESVGFGLGVGAGRGLATGAATVLEAIVVLTPAGWALIAAGLAAPGVVAAGSMAISSLGEYEAGILYDKVRRWQVDGT